MTSDDRAVLDRKLATLYPAGDARMLAEHALAPVLRGREGARVALDDYRDVLAWAESPQQMREGPDAPPADQAQARRADADEYAAWLRAP